MTNGMTYNVSSAHQPSCKARIVLFISSGAIQLLVGPGVRLVRTEQM